MQIEPLEELKRGASIIENVSNVACVNTSKLREVFVQLLSEIEICQPDYITKQQQWDAVYVASDQPLDHFELLSAPSFSGAVSKRKFIWDQSRVHAPTHLVQHLKRLPVVVGDRNDRQSIVHFLERQRALGSLKLQHAHGELSAALIAGD